MTLSQLARIFASVGFCWLLVGSAAAADWRQKVDPTVLAAAGESLATEFLVVFGEQADLSGAAVLATKAAKGRWVFEELRAVAARSQGQVLAELRARGAEHRPYWITNMIWVRGDAELIETMARRADVARLAANPWVRAELPPSEPLRGACPPGGVEASLTHVGADNLWNAGILGQNAVVAGADTGYDWDHPALRDRYRGWNGVAAEHDYNWHDAIHSGGGSCGADSAEPCDDGSHGTHTMGTMVGDDGVNRVGMAPGARWIGCRNMDQGFGSPASYSECFEFFLAPTDLAGENPDPSKSPHVINNSWGCPGFEGCTDPEVLRAVVESVRAAGIVVVVSAGNSGSSCSSVDTPAAIYDASFTVGNSSLADTIASSSSRGPVTVDGSNRLKPDVTAPGLSICSTVPGGGYGVKSGTSMSGPHVAGLVALLISAQPCLAGEVDAIESHITGTALPRTTTQTCGGVPGSEVPNNTYGWGAIRAVAPGGGVCGDEIFSDGFESGDLSAWSP